VGVDKNKLGSDLFIVDNSDAEWKVRDYLREWTEIAHKFDIATGYFEIGSLLSLDGHWQKLENIRVLMGDEVSHRTKKALLDGLLNTIKATLDQSIEREKEKNDFLTGVPAIVDALRTKKIECRAYTKDKFHAKAYITHAKLAVVGSSALVGSSNFTHPGLTANVELNVQLRREVEQLQAWFEQHWKEGVDISDDVLKVIERHTRDYLPFDVYAKALQELFRNHEISVGEWEQLHSRMFTVLDQYQKEGYQALMKIARQFGGAFLCDGVGLGKTFIGLMLIERLVLHERKRVLLLVPKAARKPVWEAGIRHYLPHIGAGGDFTNLAIYNHTDLSRRGEFSDRLERLKELTDVIIIDEAHHFRNPGARGAPTEKAGAIVPEAASAPSRYWRLFELAAGKTTFLLTATPINNSILDFQHMIELFSQRKPDYFKGAPLGIHSLPGHFRKMEKDLEKALAGSYTAADTSLVETNEVEAENVLAKDELFGALVVQRSREYVRKSQEQHAGTKAVFPKRLDPVVASYSVKKTYGHLLAIIEKAFAKDKPLFSLAMYYPLSYYKADDKPVDPFIENRQKQVVGLIRTLFLKRFESSAKAFELSCETLLLKLLTFVTKNSKTDSEKRRVDRWKAQQADLIAVVRQHQAELAEDDEPDEDVVTEEMLDDAEELSRDQYRVEDMLAETYLDLSQIAEFLSELQKFKPTHDDKLAALITLLKKDNVLKKHKVMIFSEFMATARYLQQQLQAVGIDGVEEIDSGTKRDRGLMIKQFAPYYNESSSGDLQQQGLTETRVLIATDVLSEGLNLQDATRVINYDLHWNPVRLMQRIGRVDRRLNVEIEARICKDHPGQKEIRGEVAYWNFLPPDELDTLLRLYKKVSHKTLRISKTFGIEGKKLLRPEDDFEALRDFLHAYEGTTTPLEEMHLEYQKLLADHPGLAESLQSLPNKVFSGKAHVSGGSKAVFFCYALPSPPPTDKLLVDASQEWSLTGHTRWYMLDLANNRVLEDASEIVGFIRADPTTSRRTTLGGQELSDTRTRVERHIKNTYLKHVQAPIGVRPVLKAWMELS
jgi:superfamily II DNA or RNA helicase